MTRTAEVLKIMMLSRGYSKITSVGDKILAEKPNGDVICALPEDRGKVSVDTFNGLISRVASVGARHALIVCEASARVRKVAEDAPIRTETFSSSELSFDITRHFLQPVFRKTSYDHVQFEKAFGRYGTMELSDPVARWYDWGLGDVIEITRNCGGVYHRVVRH